MTCKARKINKLFGYRYDPVTLKKIKGLPGYMVQRVTCSADKISRLTNPQIDYIIEQVNSKMIASPVNEISESVANTSANDPSDDNSFISAEEEDYLKMLTGSIDEETAYWGTPYEAKENKTSSSVATPPSRAKADMYFDEEEGESNENDNGSEANESDSDDEYDHELHERLTREEMARIAKLEDKTPTKPKGFQRDQVNDADVDFDKIIMEVLEEHETYFDDPAPQLVTVNA